MTTPWWYPSQTAGGEMRAERLVFPIPSGMSWRDVGPVSVGIELPVEPAKKKPRARKTKRKVMKKVKVLREMIVKEKVFLNAGTSLVVGIGPYRLVDVKKMVEVEEEVEVVEEGERVVSGQLSVVSKGDALTDNSQLTTDNSSCLKKMARELRDQWMEEATQRVSPGNGKYDVVRVITNPTVAKIAA